MNRRYKAINKIAKYKQGSNIKIAVYMSSATCKLVVKIYDHLQNIITCFYKTLKQKM